ncbi:BRCA2-interacting transcriptional repressor EMSY [Anthonomus grandis grandis]|uniref:BRCA2-interacting transcriptional repressor EMSY n=1 Tax=Anthonomus grandis grandis TaxID=2921223 RepID=UPI002166BE38|nr:BRCA2-interacting transcriptional repressor EMSY [Anthonomus grandis grandis]
MWPVLLDMTEDESLQNLRHLELEAYAALVSALRAQGALDSKRKQILTETGILLNISSERHKAEVRRAINDEKLNTIAYYITGHINTIEEWAQEGRRKIPLLSRAPPITPYSVIADESSEVTSKHNETLPLPSNTERKRAVAVHVSPPLASPAENGKISGFRVPEVPKEEHKKRRCHNIAENGLLGPKGLASAKIQQVYRQISKKLKPRFKIPETQTVEIRKPIQETNFIHHTNSVKLAQDIPSKHINLQEIRNPVQELQFVQRISSPNNINPPAKMNIPQNVRVWGPQSHNNQQQPHSVPSNLKLDSDLVILEHKVPIDNEEEIITVEPPQVAQKTLSLSVNKLAKLNVEKFKILPNSAMQMPIKPLQNISVQKPKMVTIQGNSGKKVIPLSQLQMLHPKGGSLKVLPAAAVQLGKLEKDKLTLSQIEPKPVSPTMEQAKTEIIEIEAEAHISHFEDNVVEMNSIDNNYEMKDAVYNTLELREENMDNTGSSTESNDEDTYEIVEEISCDVIDGESLNADHDLSSWSVI